MIPLPVRARKVCCLWCLLVVCLFLRWGESEQEQGKLVGMLKWFLQFQATPDRRKRRLLRQGLKWRVLMRMAAPRVHRRKSNSCSRMFHIHSATIVVYHILTVPLSSLTIPFSTLPTIRGEFNSPSTNFGNVHPSDVLDMPVDPNEPTYCLCHQVSYGEMIGCDNTDVSLIWWHKAIFWL